MKPLQLSMLVSAIMLMMCSGILAAEERPSKRLIKRADRFYAKRGKGRKWVERAAGCYEKALAVDPKSVEASWKFAQAAYWIGSHTEDEDEQLRILRQAIDITKRAIRIDKKSVESHYWLGIGLAKYGEVKGILNALSLVEPIRKQMRRVIELDAGFAGGGGYRILGWISHKLPGVAGGSDEKAIELIEKALKLDHGHFLNHICLAKIYLENDRPGKAREHLEFIIEAPARKIRYSEDLETKEVAKEWLAKLPASE